MCTLITTSGKFKVVDENIFKDEISQISSMREEGKPREAKPREQRHN